MSFKIGDGGPQILAFDQWLNRKFASYAGIKEDAKYGLDEARVVAEAMRRYQLPPSFMTITLNGNPVRVEGAVATDEFLTRAGWHAPTAPTISIVHFSINGAGSTWNMGYPFDIGELLDKSKCYHQPIGYNTNPVPMSVGVKDGVNEFIRQLNMPRGPRGENCTQIPWCATAYSMGAIVFMTVLMRILHGDLQQFKATYRGSSAFGNPMREHGHTFPGCSYSDGEGIVTPNAHDTPLEHWDFAADKKMAGATGDDLYTKVNKAGDTADEVADERAIWDIVNTGNPLNLGLQVWRLVTSPTFHEGEGAFGAAMDALDFFVVKGLSAHTTYQFIHPIDGDPRDCWQIALQHMRDIVARVPVRA